MSSIQDLVKFSFAFATINLNYPKKHKANFFHNNQINLFNNNNYHMNCQAKPRGMGQVWGLGRRQP